MLKEPRLKQIINYYIEKASILSFPFNKGYNDLRKELGDYLTEDIANEWIHEDLKGLVQIRDNGIISDNAIALHETINKNFDDVSFNGPKYEEKIWTLEGLESHPFWQDQRKLAKELLTELEKIEID